MNRLKELRKSVNVTTRQLAKYTGVSSGVISLLENNRRAFMQNHINRLVAFFNVTSDYLLGRNDLGIVVYLNGENSTLLTENEYYKVKQSIAETIIKNPSSFEVNVNTGVEEININNPTYYVYREMEGDVNDNLNLRKILKEKLIQKLDTFNAEKLAKVSKIIEIID